MVGASDFQEPIMAPVIVYSFTWNLWRVSKLFKKLAGFNLQLLLRQKGLFTIHRAVASQEMVREKKSQGQDSFEPGKINILNERH